MDGYNENDFDSLDIYDFSWEGIDESLATNEISHLNSMILNVNLSQYRNGTYFFNIRQSDGTVSNQRVVVNH